jgi:hypothetical protein
MCRWSLHRGLGRRAFGVRLVAGMPGSALLAEGYGSDELYMDRRFALAAGGWLCRGTGLSSLDPAVSPAIDSAIVSETGLLTAFWTNRQFIDLNGNRFGCSPLGFC